MAETYNDEVAQGVMQRWERLKSSRYNYESQWQDIVDLVRPVANDFSQTSTPGERRFDRIYDGTAAQALEMLASGLHSYLTNPTDRWFDLEIVGMDNINSDNEALEWLEQVSDLIYTEYGREECNLSPALHETYLDLGGFGTNVLCQEYNRAEGHIIFQAMALADNWVLEGHDGRVNSNYRKVMWSGRQAEEFFGQENLPVKIQEANLKDPDRQWTFIHCVYPRKDRVPWKYNAGNMAFASIWISTECRVVVKEGGYQEFPYHVARWSKRANEVYGSSPAMRCLPDIKMLNAMEKTLLKSAEKMVDPPLQAENETILMPISTSPNAIIYREPGSEPITPLLTGANIPIGLEMSEQKREFIRNCFFADWVKRNRKTERQTAFEVADEREEMLRMIAPMLGRLQTELLGPMVSRSYNLLREANRIPPAPESLHQSRLKISYSSPASRAQLGIKAMAISRYLQEITPMAQVDPGILYRIDFNKAAGKLALWRGVPPEVIRSDEAVAQMQADRNEQQQQAAMAGAAEPISQAVLNLSKAKQAQEAGMV